MQRYFDYYRDQAGNGISGATVTVYQAGTSTPATIYEPDSNATPISSKANPFTTDANGYWAFAAANGAYAIRIEGSGSSTMNVPYVYLSDLSGSSTGGIGAAGSADQVQYNVGAGIFGASANFTFNPGTNVLAVSGPASTSTTTGSIVVNGGVGIAGNTYIGGTTTTVGDFWVNGANTPKIRLSGNSGQQRQLRFETAGSLRWNMYASQVAESGGNAGTAFLLEAYADDGSTLIDTPINITRVSVGPIALGGSTNRPVLSNGDLKVNTAGKGLFVKEGSNAKMGTATLVAGAVTVANTAVSATSRIFVTSNADGGTPGWLRVSARVAATSFTITSSSGTDTSTVAWMIVDPA